MVVELKTGHVPEGVDAAIKLLEAFQYLKSVDALGYALYMREEEEGQGEEEEA